MNENKRNGRAKRTGHTGWQRFGFGKEFVLALIDFTEKDKLSTQINLKSWYLNIEHYVNYTPYKTFPTQEKNDKS